MENKNLKFMKMFLRCMSTVALSLIILFGTSAGIKADEADAKRILRAMSNYMAAQESLSSEFDATLEVVTHDEQKLALASSGTATLRRQTRSVLRVSAGLQIPRCPLMEKPEAMWSNPILISRIQPMPIRSN